MVRFPQFLIASRWMSEYGDPSDPEHFDWIIKWSPYHNFDPGRQYPAMLFLTADHDTRVEPLHARKMAALMQSGASTNPVLISIEKNAGHGSGTPVAKWVNAKAEMLAFLAWQLGL
jgi:prolyl oligopeptidase